MYSQKRIPLECRFTSPLDYRRNFTNLTKSYKFGKFTISSNKKMIMLLCTCKLVSVRA